eukprot:m.1182259 g.1182259  ORF g.1182259 m.1182259 type:complete len:471 (+) comp24536_c0_seq26:197-1609(+)
MSSSHEESFHATLRYAGSQTCFVNMPQAWVQRRINEGVDEGLYGVCCFEVSSPEFLLGHARSKSVFVSWAGGTAANTSQQYPQSGGMLSGSRSSYSQTDALPIIEMDPQFVKELNLEDTQEVSLRECTLDDVGLCNTVYLEPLAAEDWEILEANAEHVESQLCNQIRVLWQGLTVPVWVYGSCVRLTVTRIDATTNASCYIVPLDGEVVVAPKVQPTRPTPTSEGPSPETLPAGVTIDTSMRIYPLDTARTHDVAIAYVNFACRDLARVPRSCTPAVWLAQTGMGLVQGDTDTGTSAPPTAVPVRLVHDTNVPQGHVMLHPAVTIRALHVQPFATVRVTSELGKPQQTAAITLHPDSAPWSESTDATPAAVVSAWLQQLTRCANCAESDWCVLVCSGMGMGLSVLYHIRDRGHRDTLQATGSEGLRAESSVLIVVSRIVPHRMRARECSMKVVLVCACVLGGGGCVCLCM